MARAHRVGQCRYRACVSLQKPFLGRAGLTIFPISLNFVDVHSVVSKSCNPMDCCLLNSCPLSQWCHPTILSSVIRFSFCLLSFQHQGLFQWVGSSHQMAEVLKLQLQHQSGLISFRIDWFDLLGVQGTLKSLLQHHSLKAYIFWHSAFYMVQLS